MSVEIIRSEITNSSEPLIKACDRCHILDKGGGAEKIWAEDDFIFKAFGAMHGNHIYRLTVTFKSELRLLSRSGILKSLLKPGQCLGKSKATLTLLLLHQFDQMLDIGDPSLSLNLSAQMKKYIFTLQQIVHHQQWSRFSPLTVIAMVFFPEPVKTLLLAAHPNKIVTAQPEPVETQYCSEQAAV